MSSFPFVPMAPARVRRSPLGPTTINQLHANAEALDSIQRIEHLTSASASLNGKHNAVEVPWVLGHIDDTPASGSPFTPTGYLFDTTFGGTTLNRPATGRYTCSIVSGVIPTALDGTTLQHSTMANVSDAAIEVKPQTITMEAVSATSFQFRVRELSSALGAGNVWADVNRDIDFGIHAPARAVPATRLTAYSNKQRRGFLTEDANDWNSIVENQGLIRAASLVEHTAAGLHSANRIAKAVVWVNWTGAAYAITATQGVASVLKSSLGIVDITMSDNFPALTTMACFPEVQSSTLNELAIINGRGFGTGAGTSKFRFCMYAYSGGNWARVDRTFFGVLYGVIV